MDPLSNIELWLAKWGLYLAGILIAIIAIVGWLGYNSWTNSHNQGKIVNANRAVGTANMQGGAAAVNTLGNNQQKNSDTDAKLPPIINNYNNYPAAKVGIDPAFLAAFDQSLCVYRSAANLPQCRTVQQADPK